MKTRAMTRNNRKRALDSPGISTKRRKNNQERLKLFESSAKKFEDIVKMPAFVDHTKLIKTFMSDHKAIFISAPPLFGKSANLNMIQTFLEIEVDSEGQPLRQNLEKPAGSQDELFGRNFALFKDTQILKEKLNNKDFTCEHFGRYPVIHLNFTVESIRSVEEAEHHCRTVIQEAFKQHKYLLQVCEPQAQEICEKWCGDVSFSTLKPKEGLVRLSEYLHLHFDRKVIVLVDEYDAVVTSAMKGIQEVRDVYRIVDLMSDIIGAVVKGHTSEKHVEKVLITGISLIAGTGFSNNLNAVKQYHFAEEERLASFYGITNSQLDDLLTKLKHQKQLEIQFLNQRNKNILEDLHKHFNGYRCKETNKRIFPLWMVLHYLQDRKIKSLPIPTLLDRIGPLFNYQSLCKDIRNLLLRNGTIQINKTVTSKHINVSLIHQLLQYNKEPNREVLFTILKNLGYLTIANEEESFQELKIVNASTKIFFERLLLEAFREIGVSDYQKRECIEAVQNMAKFVGEETKFQQHLMDFFHNFTEVCADLKRFKNEDMKEIIIQFLVFFILDETCCERLAPEFSVKNSTNDSGSESTRKGFADLVIKLDNTVFIFEIKYNAGARNRCKAGNQITKEKRKKGSKSKTSLRALTQILGEQSLLYETLRDELKTKQEKDGLLGYLSALEVLKGDNFVLIGLSVDGDYKPSISCIRNKKNPDVENVMVVSENEHKDFFRLYQRCRILNI